MDGKAKVSPCLMVQRFQSLRDDAMKKIVILGGGISGLAAAFYLQEFAGDAVDITLIDSAARLGGKIISAQEADFVIEGGPDSFITQKTAGLDLCRALGLEDALIGSSRAKHPTYVWSRGRLHPMPEGMMLMAPTMMLPFLRSRLISWPGKARMGMEVLIPRRNDDADESLASFVRRRLGAEALEKIAAPLMAGIHAADPERLSLQSTFPRFVEMEKQYGSLLRGIMQRSRARRHVHARAGAPPPHSPMFQTLRGGLQQLVDALAARLHLSTLLLNCRVLDVTREHGQYRIALSEGSRILADEIIFATPAYVTADWMQGMDSALASKLRSIRYVSTATVSLGYKREDVPHPLDGHGFVVAHNEKRSITACSWSSEKFKHRAPAGSVLLRVFVGGARAESIAEQEEDALAQIAQQELRATMGITASPGFTKVYRWHKGNPQYEVGHAALVAEMDALAARHDGLHLAGAAYDGAGIPDCIQRSIQIAQRIASKRSINRKEAV